MSIEPTVSQAMEDLKAAMQRVLIAKARHTTSQAEARKAALTAEADWQSVDIALTGRSEALHALEKAIAMVTA